MPKVALSEQDVFTDSDWSGSRSQAERVNSALEFLDSTEG